jgi:hypothetical protein
MIEADILYFALFPRMPDNHIDEAALLRLPNRLTELVPGTEQWSEVVRVADVGAETLTLYADAEHQRVVVTNAD